LKEYNVMMYKPLSLALSVALARMAMWEMERSVQIMMSVIRLLLTTVSKFALILLAILCVDVGRVSR
jgi:hypothetical protein